MSTWKALKQAVEHLQRLVVPNEIEAGGALCKASFERLFSIRDFALEGLPIGWFIHGMSS